jgi:hypothetical protein
MICLKGKDMRMSQVKRGAIFVLRLRRGLGVVIDQSRSVT